MENAKNEEVDAAPKNEIKEEKLDAEENQEDKKKKILLIILYH